MSATNPRRAWPCELGHQHKTKAKALFCQAEIILRRLRDRPAWVPSAQRVRATLRVIPADQRDDVVRPLRIGQFDWRGCLAAIAWLVAGVVAVVTGLALVVAAAGAFLVVLGSVLTWAFTTGHDLFVLAAFPLIGVVIAGLVALQRPSVQGALRWLEEMYS